MLWPALFQISKLIDTECLGVQSSGHIKSETRQQQYHTSDKTYHPPLTHMLLLTAHKCWPADQPLFVLS